MSQNRGVPRKMRRVLGFYDVSRTHFHSNLTKVGRKVFVAPPPEYLSIETGCAVLARAVYGPRDAAQCFDAFCEAVMSSMGFVI
eukprot:5931326-Amphidinium_carterae.1